MADLVRLLCGLGLEQVASYIQSGNVVFRSPGTAAALARRIEAAVAHRFDIRPRVLLLEARQLARAAAGNPFPRALPQFLHLWCLERAPGGAAEPRLAALLAGDERFVLRGRFLYLHAPRGVGRSKFAARAESVLAVAATARNWRTVTQLLAIAKRSRA